MADRKNFYLIFKETVNNAAKYSGCNNVWVKIESSKPHLKMTVKDDGKGFDQSNAKNGNGLSNIKERANQLRGNLFINSGNGKGTTVTLLF